MCRMDVTIPCLWLLNWVDRLPCSCAGERAADLERSWKTVDRTVDQTKPIGFQHIIWINMTFLSHWSVSPVVSGVALPRRLSAHKPEVCSSIWPTFPPKTFKAFRLQKPSIQFAMLATKFGTKQNYQKPQGHEAKNRATDWGYDFLLVVNDQAVGDQVWELGDSNRFRKKTAVSDILNRP